MILIKNAKIYTVIEDIIEKGSILIEKDKIKDIVVGNIEYNEEDFETVIEAGGHIVIPGIIDAHCHIGIWEDSVGESGDDVNEMSDPITPELRAIDAINPLDRTLKEAYEGGITTVATGPGSSNVVCGQFVAIKTYGKKIDDMVIKEPLAMKVALGENPKKIYGDRKMSPMTRMATAAMLREILFKTKNYVNLKEKELDMKLESMSMVIKKEIPLKIHVHRADDIFTAIRIAKEFDIDITLDHCTEGHLIADYLKEENIPIITGPTFTDRSKMELVNLTFETPAILSNMGMDVAIMTDAPEVPVYYLPLCAGLAVKAGMSEAEALKAITINPAKILGIDDRVGSIEVGKDADLVIFDGNPIKDIQAKVITTIIDGKIIYKN